MHIGLVSELPKPRYAFMGFVSITALYNHKRLFSLIKYLFSTLDFNWKEFKRYWFSRLVNWFMKPNKIPTHLLRTTFRDVQTPKIFHSKNHTHPDSAAWRSSTLVLAQMMCGSLGLQPYSYQCSTSDIRDDIDGSRNYYWFKDSMVCPKPFNPTDDHMIVIVDVDYYLDIEGFLISVDQPVLLYTFQPKCVANPRGEFTFTFNSSNEVTYQVSGGAIYQHRVWNFSVDVFVVSKGLKVKAFIVERRIANDHHEYVMLIPIGTWSGFGAILARYLSYSTLTRLSVNQGEFNVLDVHDGKRLYRSIGRVDEYNCATLPREDFDAVRSTSSNSSITPGAAVYASWVDNDKLSAAALVDYFRSLSLSYKPPVVFSPQQSVKNYQPQSEKTDYDAKPLMYPYMSAVYPNTYIPKRSVLNEQLAICSRVIMPQDRANNLVEPTKQLINFMEEFVELLIPDNIKHTGIPVDIEEVYVRQGRPTQRIILDRSQLYNEDPNPMLQTFLKAEPYQKPSDPRIITQYNSVDKREYSRFIYSFIDYVKSQTWYSFGKPPKEIADLVALTCQLSSKGVNCLDAVRMDGHVSWVVRILDLMILVRWFRKEYTVAVNELHKKQYNQRAVTQLGVHYDLEFQQGSGSADTAGFNSLRSKFLDFLARRLGGEDAQASYSEHPGQFAGDDILAADLDPVLASKAAKMIGQEVESVFYAKGSAGVNYLSRFYTISVWNGNPNSCCDLPRALAKLHVAVNLGGVSPMDKLKQKLLGLVRTDRNSPVFELILGAALRLKFIDFNTQTDIRLAGWWSKFDLDNNWPNQLTYDDKSHFYDLMLPYAHSQNLADYCYAVLDPVQLLTMPCILDIDNFVPEKPKVNMIINDDVILSADNKTVDELTNVVNPPAPQEIARTACWAFVEGKCKAGKNCKFEHIKVCKDYLEGKCIRRKCKFTHLDRVKNRN